MENYQRRRTINFDVNRNFPVWPPQDILRKDYELVLYNVLKVLWHTIARVINLNKVSIESQSFYVHPYQGSKLLFLNELFSFTIWIVVGKWCCVWSFHHPFGYMYVMNGTRSPGGSDVHLDDWPGTPCSWNIGSFQRRIINGEGRHVTRVTVQAHINPLGRNQKSLKLELDNGAHLND